MRAVSKLIVLLCVAGVGLQASAQAPAASAEGAAAGKVELIEGDVRVFDHRNKQRTVRVGDSLYEGDSVTTGANGELHLAMEDTGFIAVRPNTKMRIIQYRAQGDEQDKGVIGLVTGSLRSVSGWIGKYRPQAYQVRTKTATIGIRGTDHEPTVIPEGSAEGEPGTYDKVNAGGTYIQTAKGRIDVPEKKSAFAPEKAKPGFTGPRLLETVPRFYRPTRHENLIEKKHEFIQRSVEKRREEKRQHIKERIESRAKDKAARERQHGKKAEARDTKRAEREAQRQQRLERRQKNREIKPERAAKANREAKVGRASKAEHASRPVRESKARHEAGQKREKKIRRHAKGD